jgi:hypothetical protein
MKRFVRVDRDIDTGRWLGEQPQIARSLTLDQLGVLT